MIIVIGMKAMVDQKKGISGEFGGFFWEGPQAPRGPPRVIGFLFGSGCRMEFGEIIIPARDTEDLIGESCAALKTANLGTNWSNCHCIFLTG